MAYAHAGSPHAPAKPEITVAFVHDEAGEGHPDEEAAEEIIPYDPSLAVSSLHHQEGTVLPQSREGSHIKKMRTEKLETVLGLRLQESGERRQVILFNHRKRESIRGVLGYGSRSRLGNGAPPDLE